MSSARRRNIARLRRTQGCLTDAVAYLLNVHPERVPLFVCPRAGWSRRLKRYFRRRGYRVRWQRCHRVPARGTHLVCGNSLTARWASHVVVVRNGRLAYDPEFPSRWDATRVTHRLIVEPVDE